MKKLVWASATNEPWRTNTVKKSTIHKIFTSGKKPPQKEFVVQTRKGTIFKDNLVDLNYIE